MKFLSPLPALIILCCCNQSNKRIEKFDPQILDVRDFKLSGKRIIRPLDSLLIDFGNPDTVYVSGAFTSFDIESDKSEITEYESYIFDNIKFGVFDDYAQIIFINFHNSDIVLSHPKISLSRDTKIEEIWKVYPEQKKWKNYDINAMFGFDPKDQYNLKKETVDWITFANQDAPDRRIQLTFLNHRLAWVYFDPIRYYR